jgi:hypothetical protein
MAMARPTHPGPTVDMGRDEEGILTLIQGQEVRTDILLCPEQSVPEHPCSSISLVSQEIFLVNSV